jgi:hypothetical protein
VKYENTLQESDSQRVLLYEYARCEKGLLEQPLCFHVGSFAAYSIELMQETQYTATS